MHLTVLTRRKSRFARARPTVKSCLIAFAQARSFSSRRYATTEYADFGIGFTGQYDIHYRKDKTKVNLADEGIVSRKCSGITMETGGGRLDSVS